MWKAVAMACYRDERDLCINESLSQGVNMDACKNRGRPKEWQMNCENDGKARKGMPTEMISNIEEWNTIHVT